MNNKLNNNQLDIPFPSEEKINSSVEYIVNTSVERRNVFKEFFRMIKSVPITILFNSKMTFVLVAFIYFVATVYVDVANLYKDPNHYYQFISLLAPTAFIIGLLDIVNSRDYNMMELEMSTKYNFQQLTAYKIVILFVYSLILNIIIYVSTLYIASMQPNYNNGINTTESMLIMFSSLFLISSVSLLILLRFHSRVFPIIMLTMWYLFVIICAFVLPELFDRKVWLYTSHIIALSIGGVLHYEQIRYIFSKKYIEKGAL